MGGNCSVQRKPLIRQTFGNLNEIANPSCVLHGSRCTGEMRNETNETCKKNYQK